MQLQDIRTGAMSVTPSLTQPPGKASIRSAVLADMSSAEKAAAYTLIAAPGSHKLDEEPPNGPNGGEPMPLPGDGPITYHTPCIGDEIKTHYHVEDRIGRTWCEDDRSNEYPGSKEDPWDEPDGPGTIR